MPTRQGFKTVDRLRLEIGAPPATGLRNLIRNPSGERGAWGWHVTTSAGRLTSNRTSTDYRSGGTLTSTSFAAIPTATVMEFESEAWAITPGHYAGGSFRLVTTPNTGTTVTPRLVFRDAAGQQTGTGSPIAFASGTTPSVLGFPLAQAPAGTVSVHLRFTLTNASTSVRSFSFREVMLATSAVSADVNAPAFVEPLTWTDVLAPSLNIETDRSPLGLGILSARIRSASLDPAVSTLIRPGRPIRLMAYSTGSDWEPIFWGKIQDGKTTYDADYPIASKRALIAITATDAADELANTSAPGSYKQIRMLATHLRATGVPYVLDNTTDNFQSADPVLAVNENASVLDQIALTRDTARSYAAVTRYGVLRGIDRQYMNGVDNQTTSPYDPLVATFNQSDYNKDAVIDFDSKRLVNTVLIRCLYIKEDGTTTDGVFGPYVDAKSVQEWGAFQTTVTIVGTEDTAGRTFRATELMKEAATPTRRLQELTFPVTNGTTDFHIGATNERRVHLDLLDRVVVNNTTSGISGEHRVAAIKHIITPEKWLVRVGFSSVAGTPAPRRVADLPAGTMSTLPDTPWADVTMENGFTHHDGSAAPVQYRRLNGMVIFRGLMNGGTANLVAFRLPPGFRGEWKRGNTHFLVYCGIGALMVRVNSTTNGTDPGAILPSGAGTFIDTCQITYPAVT